MKCKTIKDFYRDFPNDDACLLHVMKTRYGMSGTCKRCNKQTNYSRVKKQRAFACQWCGNHVYPCVNTPFESSRTSLQLWFYAIYLFTVTRHGVSAKELQRQLGVTYKCAWRMAHEIRKHMASTDDNKDDGLKGVVQCDETYIGGVKIGGKRGRGCDKAIAFGMLEKNGDIVVEIVDNVKKSTLQPIIQDKIAKNSEIHTDELLYYNGLVKLGFTHKTIQHGINEYVKDGVHVNGLEGFWSYLKRSILSTHIHVSKKHLDKYINEFEYRYNSRHQSEKMFDELLASFDKPKA